MRLSILVLAIIGSLLAAPLALAQEAEPALVATITFEPDTYEVYKEYAAKGLRSIEERINALESLSPDAPDLRLGNTSIGASLHDCQAVRDVLSLPLVLDNDTGRYVLTVRASGPRDRGSWAICVKDVLARFHPCDTAAFEAKRAENDAKAEALRAEAEKVQKEREGAEDRLKSLGIVKVEMRRDKAQEAMLDLRLAKAEAEARRDAAMAKLEETRKQPDDGAAPAQQQKRQLAQQRVELAAKAVDRVKQLLTQGMTGSADLERAEQALAEAQIDAAVFEEEAKAPRPSSPAETQLTSLLIEAEIDLAGLEAKERVLEDEMAGLSEALEEHAAAAEGYERLLIRLQELGHEVEELDKWPKSPSDFPVTKPVIEWAQRPEEKEE